MRKVTGLRKENSYSKNKMKLRRLTESITIITLGLS